MKKSTGCYCASGRSFSDCCEPIIAGSKPAPTAEALMRSRYTAFVLKESGYLLKTFHPTTRPSAMDLDLSPAWCGLRVLAVEQGQQGDEQGIVEFRAFYTDDTGKGVLHERSRFVFEKRWYYIDGDLLESGSIQYDKTGRNELCPCGSGKKYKKCCLQR